MYSGSEKKSRLKSISRNIFIRWPASGISFRQGNFSILNTGYWILDAGYSMLDTGCWLLDPAGAGHKGQGARLKVDGRK
jgi:hypothetical protein